MKPPITLCLLILSSTFAFGAQPDWWTDYSLVDGSARQDSAIATIGQAKHVIQKAYLYLEAELSEVGGAGAEVTSLYNNYCTTAPGHSSDDLQLLTIGQLKYLAKPFYDRLNSATVDFKTSAMNSASSDHYPWTVDNQDDADMALATLGQLKFAFSFDLSSWSSPNPVITNRTDWYIDAVNGDDTLGTGSSTKPFQSLSILSLNDEYAGYVNSGDTIYLASGDYSSEVDITIDLPGIVIEGTLYGNGKPSSIVSNVKVTADGVSLKNLLFENSNLILENASGGIFSNNKFVDSDPTKGTLATTFMLKNSSNNIVSNNYFGSAYEQCVFISLESRDNQFLNNYFTHRSNGSTKQIIYCQGTDKPNLINARNRFIRCAFEETVPEQLEKVINDANSWWVVDYENYSLRFEDCYFKPENRSYPFNEFSVTAGYPVFSWRWDELVNGEWVSTNFQYGLTGDYEDFDDVPRIQFIDADGNSYAVETSHNAGLLPLHSIDTDNDGIDDSKEISFFGNLLHSEFSDYDFDGLNDAFEIEKGLDPTNAYVWQDPTLATTAGGFEISNPNLFGTILYGINGAIQLSNSANNDNQSTIDVSLGSGPLFNISYQLFFNGYPVTEVFSQTITRGTPAGPSRPIYYGPETPYIFGAAGKYSYNKKDLFDPIEVGRGWIISPTSFRADRSVPSRKIYYGSKYHNFGNAIFKAFIYTYSDRVDNRVEVGRGWITSAAGFIVDKDVNSRKIYYGRKRYYFSNANRESKDIYTYIRQQLENSIEVGNGWITSASAFVPNTAVPARSIYEGEISFPNLYGGINTRTILSYDGSRLNNSSYFAHGWLSSVSSTSSSQDTDSDNLFDGLERFLGTSRYSPDTDQDGISDYDEFKIYQTDPLNWDTDGDLLMDGLETQQPCLDPLSYNDPNQINATTGLTVQKSVQFNLDVCNGLTDSDGDQLDDLLEISTYGTQVGNPDTDMDGVEDGVELQIGLNPFLSDAYTLDSDLNEDGIDDSVGIELGISISNDDSDSDGLSNVEEIVLGTNPLLPDTDGDGADDPVDEFPLDPDLTGRAIDSGDLNPPNITLLAPSYAIPL